MIEPPGKLRIVGILEIHYRVLIAVEQRIFEDLRCPMGHPCIGELRVRMNRAFDKTTEERSRGGAIEAVIVIEDSDEHFGDGRMRGENLSSCLNARRIATIRALKG